MPRLASAVLALMCACNPTDDGKTDGSATTGGTSSETDGTGGTGGTGETGGSGSGSESQGTTAPTSGGDPDCSGDYQCFGVDAADCEDDKCCVAAFGRRYQQTGDMWCLGAEDEYVGCAHKYNSAPCDHVGTIRCTDMNDQEYFAELAMECFPHGCMTGVAPATGGAVCGE